MIALSWLTLLAVGQATVVIRLGILRVEANGLGVVGDGLVERRPSYRRRCPGCSTPRLFRVEADGLGVVGDGLVELALLLVGDAPVAVRLRRFGLSRMASV